MTEDELAIVRRVTSKLVPKFKVGDLVEPTWTPSAFGKSVVTKIEKGWYHFQSVAKPRLVGATEEARLKHYG